ncbi:MAG: DUF1501 domain-containing protein [Rhodothermales bacterium]|nr:DUF1501 domain-containing protein [Rhodothermales bacterium]MBO6780519.1 DUF1501 domain-containing protein [Rhodothermales bacterium]
MCSHDRHLRTGARLEDGSAHSRDHEAWTRRQFMSTLGLAGLGTFVAGGLPARAVLGAPVIHPLAAANSDRVLVLIQLEGGNDGLNTVIPVDDDRYYRNRPVLSIPKTDALDVGLDFRLNNALAPLANRLSEGTMQVVHAVGYDSPDLSHFRSTDIWVTASDSEQMLSTGWVGRAVETNWPTIIADPPSSPLAVQIGGAAMMFRGDQANVGASFRNTEQLARLAEGGVNYDPTAVPDSRPGRLMSLTREIANQSYRYAAALQDAAGIGNNEAGYPDGSLGEQLAMVARLIKGGLGSRVYHVSLSGFDTHALQIDAHPALLSEFATATTAFLADIEAGGRANDVLVMTFSEFGRTVAENGARGTDHATVAPMFLFGGGLASSSIGIMPDLDVVNEFGDLEHIIDFRRVYATVLEEWLRVPEGLVDQTLGRPFERLSLFSDSVSTVRSDLPQGFRLGAAFPNPAASAVRVALEAPIPAELRVEVFDASGRRVLTPGTPLTVVGRHEVQARVDQLPAGTYFMRVRLGAHTETRTFVKI